MPEESPEPTMYGLSPAMYTHLAGALVGSDARRENDRADYSWQGV